MRTDTALHLLTAQLQQQPLRILAIADEQLALLPAPPTDRQILYLSNRIDVASGLERHGARVDCSDFDFSGYSVGQFDRVIYRISKEKAVVHHILNNAARLLSCGGELVLIGHKREGLNSYARNAARLFAGKVQRLRENGGYSVVTLTRSQHIGPKLDDSDYTLTREVVATDEGLTFYSKPGIYGWQKVDVGSALLVAAMQQDLHADPSTPAPAILDLGCGYGYLAVMAALSTGGSVLATDNNMAAIIACEKNLRHHRITGCALADDCGASIVQSFDLVVCNPPFHQGFDTSRSITEKFLGAARQHLRPRGRAYFVVNRFIEIEARARHLFGSVEQIKCERGFKILRMQS